MAAFPGIKTVFKVCCYLTLGGISWIGVVLYIILSTPIFIYRVFVTKLFVICSSKNIRDPVYSAQFAATDFIPRYITSSHRASTLSKFVFKGTISPTSFHETIERQWLARRNEDGKIMFPQLQQYMDNFMGFMFWIQDEQFKLRNHVYLHDIGNNSTSESCETFICNLSEKLLNKCFCPKKSPWEVHLVNNYKSSSICNETMSIFVFRFHHAVGDGVSMLNVLGEVLYEKRVEDLKWAIQRPKPNTCLKIGCIFHVIPNIMRMVYDLGYLVALWFQKYKTQWLVPDSVKTNRQLFVRTEIIPVDYIKQIKNKFGVKFSSVLLSCISAAVSKRIKCGAGTTSSGPDTVAVLIPIPLWSASKTFGIFSTVMIMDLPLSCDIDPIERLYKCQNLLESAEKSTIPFLFNLFRHLGNSNLAIISRFLVRNVKFSIFLSIFPIPEEDAKWNGENSLLGYDSCVGCQLGDAGAGVILASYKGNTRISITTEAALMDKQQLNSLMADIKNELQQLDNCSLVLNLQQV